MYQEVAGQIVSLIYIFILSLVYFLKRKYNFLESKFYKSLLVVTIISIILDISSICLLKADIYSNILCLIVSKLYFISIFVWLIIFIFYVILNKINIKYDSFKGLIKQSVLCKTWILISIILFILLLFSNIGYTVEPLSYYGASVMIVYVLGMAGSLFLLLFLLMNNKNVSSYKNWAILFSIIILCLSFFIQFSYNSVLILGSGISLITLFLYFTIENPDLKYIEELNVLKETA